MNSRIRVLHINLSPLGIGRYGVLFALALAQRDDVEVLSIFDKRLLENDLLRNLASGLKTQIFSLDTRFDQLAALPKLKKIIKEWHPDIVHNTDGSSHPYGILASSLLARGKPWVINEHDPVPHSGMGKTSTSQLARFLIRHWGKQIFVHGPSQKKELIRLGVSPSKISVIYHGLLSPLVLHPNASLVKREAFTVLFFGELRPNKGVELLLPIADKVYKKLPYVRFLIAGSPTNDRSLNRLGWQSKLEKILDEMRKRPYFEVHDRFIPDEEVATLFSRAAVTLLPYLDASQSGVAMIAMPLNSVVIATNVGDISFVVHHEHTGFLTTPDIDSIANTIIYALSHSAQLEKIRKSAKEWAEQECNWDDIARKVVNVYQKMIVEK